MANDWRIGSWPVKPGELFDLSGKVAIVTGASSGIGRAIALGLDAFGARVSVVDIDAAGAEEVARELSNPSLVVQTDVTAEADVRRMVQLTLDRFGQIDISFNIPGVSRRSPILELSLQDWQRMLDVNLTGMFLCLKEVGRVMLERGRGTIVNMASARGLVGGAHHAAYSATKGGVVQLTRSLAAEWAPGVRVNALAPGYVKTPMVNEIMQDQAWYEEMANLAAMKRWADPEEMVGPAIFLASDASSFVTGAILSVDGGWTAT